MTRRNIHRNRRRLREKFPEAPMTLECLPTAVDALSVRHDVPESLYDLPFTHKLGRVALLKRFGKEYFGDTELQFPYYNGAWVATTVEEFLEGIDEFTIKKGLMTLIRTRAAHTDGILPLEDGNFHLIGSARDEILSAEEIVDRFSLEPCSSYPKDEGVVLQFLPPEPA